MLLVKAEIPDYLYTIGGLGAGECVGIIEKDGEWQTYFSEKGAARNLVVHPDENAACRAFLNGVAEIMEEYTGRVVNWKFP
jgi:hypothetical protein